jgi:hypothetical protein
MENPRFYVYDDFFGKWHWKFFARDPKTRLCRTLATCESPFETKEECERDVEQLREHGLSGHTHYRQSTS